MAMQLTPRSRERYAEIVTKNILPLLGTVLLAKLQPAMISAAYASALRSGRADGKGGLSPGSVHYIHRVLRQALGQAVAWKLLAHNPAAAVRPPKCERKDMAALDTTATARLIEAARESSLFIPILLAVLCGLRRGEIAALRWRAIDLERGELSVVASIEQSRAGVREKPPKSGRGRTIAMPGLLIEELHAHRRQQAESLLRVGIRRSDDVHVVTRPDGAPFKPQTFSQTFPLLLAKLGLARIRFHDLRHTHATQLLSSGVHPKVAQERLGHHSIAMTLDLYSHVMPGMQADAADRVDLAVRTALDQQRRKR
jgi:integrase